MFRKTSNCRGNELLLVENHIPSKGAKLGLKFKDFKLNGNQHWVLSLSTLYSTYTWERPIRCTFISLIFFPIKLPLNISNKQVHRQEVISLYVAYSISRASIGCLAANTIRFLKLSEDVFDEKVDRVILFHNYSFPLSWSLNCLLDKLAVSILWSLGL